MTLIQISERVVSLLNVRDGGEPTFAEAAANGEVAPIAAIG